jgi:hypothetical protein
MLETILRSCSETAGLLSAILPLSELVECHSGYAYGERPVAFTWQGQRQEVVEILARWRSPDGRIFRVRAAGGWIFELLYHERDEVWHIQQR